MKFTEQLDLHSIDRKKQLTANSWLRTIKIFTFALKDQNARKTKYRVERIMA